MFYIEKCKQLKCWVLSKVTSIEMLWTTKAFVPYMNMQAVLDINHKCIKSFSLLVKLMFSNCVKMTYSDLGNSKQALA